MTATPTALPVYDWLEPAHLQETDADCEPESVEWCLYAWGRTPDDDWIEQSQAAAGVWSPSAGCLDASGSGVAAWLNAEYAEFGYVASNADPVTFDEVAAEAAAHLHPLAVGGRGWYHWSGVRGFDGERLLLANPAPGYRGVHQTMTRAQFDALGPFSLVRLTHPEAEAAGAPPPTVAWPQGVDISSWQGECDYAAMAGSGLAFAIAKATEAVDYTNPYFAGSWAAIRAHGMQRGAYHFARPDDYGPEDEAAYFASAIGACGGLEVGDLVALDLEAGSGNLADWALRWLRAVEARYGFPPLLYSNPSFIQSHGLTVPDLARYPLWLAAWGAAPPPVPPPWTQTVVWQWTDRGHVPGITGPVDRNAYLDGARPLTAYGKPQPSLPPANAYAPPGSVGSGLLELMAADGTSPALPSTWLPLGAPTALVEESTGLNGVIYRWHLPTGMSWRYRPS